MKPDWIICCRVARVARDSYIVPGSVTANCSKCGELVLVSPSSLEIFCHDNSKSRLLCMECAFAQIDQCGGEIVELTTAQVREVEEYRRRSC